MSRPALAANETPASLRIVRGAVNGAFVERDGKVLVVYGDPAETGRTVDTVLLTHGRRDAIWGARELARHGARVIVPEGEAGALGKPQSFWEAFRLRRFHDYAQQTTKVPVEPLSVAQTVKADETFKWCDLSIQVLDTPGYTRNAVSYLTILDGQRVAFTGDLVRDDGKLQDLFSLQDSIAEAKVGGYHGWAGRLGRLMASLDRVAAVKPDLLVPLRGPVIREPVPTIRRLQQRIRAAYANYLSIDALRWYFKDDHIRAKARLVLGPEASVDWMPMAETLPLPESIVAISNSRLILASDGSGFLVDCGGEGIIAELRKLRAAGKLTRVEDVFVTHYHDDHTDALPTLVSEFGAKVHACGSLVDLIERPADYRLPCLTTNPTPVTAKHNDGDAWQWKEYRLKIRDYPGQTLHHNALLVERPGAWSAFFVGDSFTPTGIDDYCLQNRNVLREGQGFFRCLDLLETLPSGCLLLNQHVEPAFRFATSQIARMRETLRRRIPLLAELFPFDDPNFGLDEGWAALHPYWVTARRGDDVALALKITNHSPRERTYRGRVRAPQGLQCVQPLPVRVAAGAEVSLPFRIQVTDSVRDGLCVVVADVTWDDGELREWTEAVIEVKP